MSLRGLSENMVQGEQQSHLRNRNNVATTGSDLIDPGIDPRSLASKARKLINNQNLQAKKKNFNLSNDKT